MSTGNHNHSAANVIIMMIIRLKTACHSSSRSYQGQAKPSGLFAVGQLPLSPQHLASLVQGPAALHVTTTSSTHLICAVS